MFRYTSKSIYFTSFIISIILYSFISLLFYQSKKNHFNLMTIFHEIYSNTIQIEIKSNEIEKNGEEEAKKEEEDFLEEKKEKSKDSLKTDWKIKIPCISLEAPISEGTDKNILNQFVGHFEESSLLEGNIGLAAHNRGYAVNYFENIKKLKEGNEIFYQYKDKEKVYIVIKNWIIEDTDWTCLENTKENTITLITCVENEPTYRRCVQAIEKRKEIFQ